MQDIIPYVKDNLVIIFEELSALRDNYYTNIVGMAKVKRK